MQNKKLNILFENNDVIVIDKEPNIFVFNEETKNNTI